jgi:uncharacterized protein (DUF362 family)
MGSLVSLVRANGSEDLAKSVDHAVSLLDFKMAGPVRSVVVKPNLCYYWDASTGYTTDPRLVAGVIDLVRRRFGEGVNIKVAEADASAMRTRHVFPVLGYDKLAKEKDVELVNLSNEELLDETVNVDGHEISFKVPTLLKKCDLFVNVPKLKIMRATKITCAMKNIFGCIGFPKKLVYHNLLNEAIVGINKLLHPHLTIVDGLIGLGRCPAKLDLVMAGTDVFSVDWIASQIMGFNQSAVRFLELAVKEKVGNPDGVAVVGENPAEFAKIFPKEGFVASKYLWSVQFWLLSAYRKVTGDIIPPVIEGA